MRCWILSDLHRDIGLPWQPSRIPDADVAIVAGDVGQGLVDSIGWLAAVIRPHMRVVFVAGNHEFYRTAYAGELALGRMAARNQDIDFLEDDTAVIDGVAFHGCTLWTDYRLDGDAQQGSAMDKARRGLNDHRLITWTRQPRWLRFRPEEALTLHRASRAFLVNALGPGAYAGSPRPTRIVVSHHAPSAGSIAKAFQGDALNPAFASCLDTLIDEGEPTLWVHGHTHSGFDYRIGATRVLCNPKGYHRENARFDPELVVDVPS